MVVTPNIKDLTFEVHNGEKYFELVAEPVEQEILPGLFIKGWGYNGSIPGPTILVNPGDNVRIRVINYLPEATSVHWHGLDIPNVMDGVPDVEPSPRISPGQYFDYRFRITNPPGTHMYHTHVDSARQQMLGMGGAFIIEDPQENQCRDYFYMVQEFQLIGLEDGEVKPGTYDLDPYSMDFNFFTMNGRCFPFVEPIRVKLGDKERVRFGSIAHNAHPMHIHGHQFAIAASDGNEIHTSNRLVKNTVNVASGETYDVIFYADNPGVWPFHCHIAHHMSNNFTKPLGGMTTTVVYEC